MGTPSQISIWAGGDGVYWSGLTDRENEGDFVWGSGRQLSGDLSDNWAPGQPDNFNNEDCATAQFSAGSPSTLLNDLSCDREQNFICQKREYKRGGKYFLSFVSGPNA